jgi:hypothetical protein
MVKLRRTVLLFPAFLFPAFAFALAFALTFAPASRAAAAWLHEAYVWQRQPGLEVAAAMRDAAQFTGGFCILAAEISWSKGAPVVTRTTPDYAKLAALGKPAGLALRIGTPPNSRILDFKSQIIAEAVAIVSSAAKAGFAPAELQIDYDCPESKLDAYRQLLAGLRQAVGATPLTFTALPAWLKHDGDFAALAREVAPTGGGFVLQVHSLEKPADIDAPFTLCDPARALVWTRQADTIAARSGARFRIALPTYGYVLGFNESGRFIGLAAETPRDWPANTQLRAVRSDPVEMSKLAQQLAAGKFPRADGIIWFRLPVEGDRLTWNATTFATVVRGGPVESRLEAIVWRRQPGLAEIAIVNCGQTTLELPRLVRIEWTPGPRVTACDELAGYEARFDGGHKLDLHATRAPPTSALAPGQSRIIGWIRFNFPDDKIPDDKTTSTNTTASTNTFSIHATIP